MHPVNKVLSFFGLELQRAEARKRIPREFRANYNQALKEIKRNGGVFKIVKDILYDVGSHPSHHSEAECEFASYFISELKPDNILDIGSYRLWLIGLLSSNHVTTIDVRPRKSTLANEDVVTCDAKDLEFPDNSFDAVTSLFSIQHFGLGRYGDELDLDADKKAFNEMVRVLKPNGYLIFSTYITNAQPFIMFNARRVYSYEMIRAFCTNLTCIEEKFYSKSLNRFCPLEEVTAKKEDWDIYLGCWGKIKGSGK